MKQLLKSLGSTMKFAICFITDNDIRKYPRSCRLHRDLDKISGMKYLYNIIQCNLEHNIMIFVLCVSKPYPPPQANVVMVTLKVEVWCLPESIYQAYGYEPPLSIVWYWYLQQMFYWKFCKHTLRTVSYHSLKPILAYQNYVYWFCDVRWREFTLKLEIVAQFVNKT